MLRTTVDPQPTLWEAILPPECRAMSPSLERVDRLLEDPAFFEPFVPHFDPTMGRPSIPMETYLRMMYLRFRYRLGFETLCAEVTDSFSWRVFCRIGLTERVPHPSTLEKITARCGEETVAQLGEILLHKAAEAKVVRLDKVRADTTVIEANVAYPTDSGLLAKGVATLAKSVTRLKALGLAPRTSFRNRTRSVRRRAHAIALWLRKRSGEAKDEVLTITGELAGIAEATIADARAVARNATRRLGQGGQVASGRARALVADIERTAAVLETIVAQARTRVGGEVPDGGTRVVSLHDTDARPIAKGRLGKPVEFGFKAQVVDNADGLVLDHDVEMGNPPDAPRLAPAIRRLASRFGRAPHRVTADRGYGEAGVDAELEASGVKRVAILRKGRPNKERQEVESSRSFRNLVKWRTGSEGRVSHMKHAWGWNRTRLDGIDGARIWCAWGVVAHNATRISMLIEDKHDKQTRRRSQIDAPDAPESSANAPPGRRRTNLTRAG